MKTKNLKQLTFAMIAAVLTFSACNNSPYPDYDQTESGLYYKFHIQNEEGVKAKEGDMVKLILQYKTSKDSVLFDSKTMNRAGNIYVEFPLSPSMFKGSFEEALTMMAVGDSASFLISADSLFKGRDGAPSENLPAFIEKGSMLTFDVKLESLVDKATVEKQRKQEMEEYQAMVEYSKSQEPKLLADYLAANKISAKPTASGLYVIETTKGKGAKPVKGDTVHVHYTGRLLDGTVFDTSIETIAKEKNLFNPNRPYEPYPFVLQEGGVIEGWHEGIALLRVGSKATLLIPSALAYGAQGGGRIIPPYTTLIFDVELVKSVSK